MMQLSSAFGVLCILLCCGTNTLAAETLLKRLLHNDDIIVAHIKLRNTCDIDDKYFIVRDLNTNKYANFYNGIAKLNTRMNSALQLQLSPSVKYVRFEGNAVAAKKKLELIADCRDRNMRMIGR